MFDNELSNNPSLRNTPPPYQPSSWDYETSKSSSKWPVTFFEIWPLNWNMKPRSNTFVLFKKNHFDTRPTFLLILYQITKSLINAIDGGPDYSHYNLQSHRHAEKITWTWNSCQLQAFLGFCWSDGFLGLKRSGPCVDFTCRDDGCVDGRGSLSILYQAKPGWPRIEQTENLLAGPSSVTI